MRISTIYREFLDRWPNPERYLQRHMRFLQTYHANYVTRDLADPDAVVADYRQVWTEERVAEMRQRVQGVDLETLIANGSRKAAALTAPAENPDAYVLPRPTSVVQGELRQALEGGGGSTRPASGIRGV